MSRAVMQQALEALERGETKLRWTAINALRAALAEPEQEPVPWEQFYPDIGKPQTTHWEGCEAVHPECRKPDTDCHAQGICQRSGYSIAPTPRKPVELTDEEIVQVLGSVRESITGNVFLAFARAVIAAYEAKNGIAGEGAA